MGVSFGPVVVAVCGSPAAGKTTTAREIAGSLRLPLISRDELAVGLRLGASEHASADEIRSAAENAMISVAERLAAAGVSFVLESSVLDAAHLAAVAQLGARVLVVHVTATPGVIGERLRARVAAGEPGMQRLLTQHNDGTMRPEIFAPWSAAHDVISIDTSTEPPVSQIVPIVLDAMNALLG